jgi:hypothetical protein
MPRTVKLENYFQKGRLLGNVNNLNINLIVDKTSEAYSEESKTELLKSISELISGHAGPALDFDNSVEIVTSTSLTEIQKNQIKEFKKAGWTKDKIHSIKTAFKIVNLEDRGHVVEASNLMASAFNGSKQALNRKFYNLARAGYLDSFALDLLYSGNLHSDEGITKILDYFSEAIFLDQDFYRENLVDDLNKRENENVKRITVYARGHARIQEMELGYNLYLGSKIKSGDKEKGNRRDLYILESKESYQLGKTDCERLVLVFRELVLRDIQ